MKKLLTKSLTVLLLVLLICSGAFYFGFKQGKVVQRDEDRFLEQKCDSLQNIVYNLNALENMFESEIDSLKLKLEYSNQELNEIRKKHTEQIKLVTTYSNCELEQFFSDRYGISD